MKTTYKKTFLAVTVKENDKYYSYVVPVTNGDNLVQILQKFYTANICSSKKEAGEIVERWNAIYRMHGEYAFDDAF